MSDDLDEEDRQMRRHCDPKKLAELADEALTLAREVQRRMQLSPGGDLYTYTGSTSDVDAAREAMEAYELYILECQS